MIPILNQSLWRDEAFSALLSEKNPLQIIVLSMQDTTPPLHYLLLHYWMLLFGQSEVALRGLSFIFHLLTVLVVFLIARKLIKSTIVQLLITITVLLNPFLLQYAFEARAYALLAFFTVLTLYFVISKRFILAGIALACAVFTHDFALFTFIACAGWFLHMYRNRLKENIKEGTWFFGFSAVALFMWGSIIFQQWVNVAHGFWIKPATFSLFLDAFQKFTTGSLPYQTQPMLYTFTLILCFFAFGYWMWREQKEEQGNALLLLSFVALVPVLITYFISALFAPIYDDRYLIATTPLLIILVGYSLNRLFQANNKLKNLLVACVAVYILLLVQSSEQIVSKSTKAPINYAVSQVLSKAHPNDIIISQSDLNFLETKWYISQSGSTIPVRVVSLDGKIPFYVGAILFESQDIIPQTPIGVRVWEIKQDGGYAQLMQ